MKEIFPINGADFECEFTLYNSDNNEEISFTKSSIKSLDLQENLFEPFQNATVTINNPFDFIDNTVLTRGDGRDKFKFSLKNKNAPDEDTLEYTFVVDGENNNTSKTDRSNNFKEFRLLDDKYFKLNEPIPYGTRFKGYVGDIIREIIEEKIGEDVIGDFEPGDHEIRPDSIPEYIIPPISFRYSDLIKYLLRIYYKKEGDLMVKSLLRYDRFEKKYSLIPITKMFADNTKLLQEGFTAGDLIGNPSDNKNNPPPEAPVNVYQTQLFNTNFTTPMLTYSNEYFLNFMASGYDPIMGMHGIREVRIADVKEKWAKKFVDVFKSVGGRPKPFLPLNQEKTERLFKTFSFPFTLEHTRALAEAEMVYDLTFYNLQLSINNLGDTRRTAGKFIDIYRQDFDVDPETGDERKVDKKLLGRWLVTKCRHTFTYDSYQNTLQCIKPYVGPDTKINDDIA